MKSSAVPNLPRYPNTMRAQCPKGMPDNYLSSYLWRFCRALDMSFPKMFFDMYYGYMLFPDKPALDDGEVSYDDVGVDIEIDGVEYTKPWASPSDVFTITAEDPDHVRRYGYDCDPDATYADAWDMYDDSPLYETVHRGVDDGYCNVIAGNQPSIPECPGGGGGCRAIGNKYYFKFNTSSISEPITTATITFTCKARNNTGLPNPTLYLYCHDYVTVDTGDWTGGEKIAEYLLDVGNVWPLETVNVSMPINIGYVNTIGYSFFRLNFKETEEGTHSTGGTGFHCQNIETVKLTVEY